MRIFLTKYRKIKKKSWFSKKSKKELEKIYTHLDFREKLEKNSRKSTNIQDFPEKNN